MIAAKAQLKGKSSEKMKFLRNSVLIKQLNKTEKLYIYCVLFQNLSNTTTKSLQISVEILLSKVFVWDWGEL